MAVVDMVKLADSQWEAGADAIDWDTTGASGDPEFLAALRATKIIREKYPDMGVQLGMAGEFVLGMHGQLEWDGVRLAGLWPREQLLLAQKAGATMFGPVVNVNTGKSLRLEHGPRHRPHQAVHGRWPRSPCTPTPAWAWAACRCSCTCRRTPCAGRPSRSSSCCTWTGCRWARAIPTGCTTPTRKPRASAVFGQAETWLPVCR